MLRGKVVFFDWTRRLLFLVLVVFLFLIFSSLDIMNMLLVSGLLGYVWEIIGHDWRLVSDTAIE
jgi:hypothetical protein